MSVSSGSVSSADAPLGGSKHVAGTLSAGGGWYRNTDSALLHIVLLSYVILIIELY